MGDIHGMKHGITLAELAEKSGGKYDTLYRKAKREFPAEIWTADSVLLPEHIAVLRPRKSGGSARKKSNFNPQRQSTPPAPDKTGDGNSARNFSETVAMIRHFAVGVVLVAVVICHAALVWYDCAHLYGWAGVIGGAAVFLIVLAAVLLAADREKYSTSEAALWFVFVVDCAAWWVHFPVFDTPDVSSRVTGFLCGFLCAASWVALYLFRNYKLEQ